MGQLGPTSIATLLPSSVTAPSFSTLLPPPPHTHTRAQVHAVMWSAKPSDLPVTVTTQLSVSRLPQLYAQCKSWSGPLSAAVYVPLVESELRAPGDSDPDMEGVEDDGGADGRRTVHRVRARQARAAQQHARRFEDMARNIVRRLEGLPSVDAARAPLPPGVGAPEFTWTRMTQMARMPYEEIKLSPRNREALNKAREVRFHQQCWTYNFENGWTKHARVLRKAYAGFWFAVYQRCRMRAPVGCVVLPCGCHASSQHSDDGRCSSVFPRVCFNDGVCIQRPCEWVQGSYRNRWRFLCTPDTTQ